MELALNEIQLNSQLSDDSNEQLNPVKEFQLALASGGVGEVSPY